MVGVGVTKSDYNRMRRESRASHKKIIADQYFGKWRMPGDVTKTTPVERVLGVVAMPILGLWAFILLMITIGMTVVSLVLKVAGMLFRRSRDT